MEISTVNRRQTFISRLLMLALLSLNAQFPAQAAPAPDPSLHPNIVFILTDDQRLEDIDHMPHLQKLLIGQGMSFNNHYCNVSLCCPSRVTILRGQYAH